MTPAQHRQTEIDAMWRLVSESPNEERELLMLLAMLMEHLDAEAAKAKYDDELRATVMRKANDLATVHLAMCAGADAVALARSLYCRWIGPWKWPMEVN